MDVTKNVMLYMAFTLKRLKEFYDFMARHTVPVIQVCLGG